MGSGDESLGEFEHLVLLAIIRLGDAAAGVEIRSIIEEKGQRSVSFGAVYSTLRRLESKSYIIANHTPKAGPSVGRPRRFYQMTDRGLQVVRAAQRRLKRMADGIALLADAPPSTNLGLG